jgi:hypothetical protein
MLDRVRESFERLGPRERRLASWFGVVLVVCGLGYVGILIHDGLADLESQNDNTRYLLASLEERRDALMSEKSEQGRILALITEEAPAIGTYVEKIAGENGVQIKAQSEKPTTTKGKFHELSSEITFNDLTLEQLAKLLRGLETVNPIFVTQKLDIRRSTMQKEKIDRVTITLATYQRSKAAPAAPPPAGEAKP